LEGGVSDYAKQKLWEAVGFLATSDETIQRRLGGAGLSHAMLRPEDLPEEQRTEFSAVAQELRAGPGSIEETTGALSSERCRLIAGRIFSIFTQLFGGL